MDQKPKLNAKGKVIHEEDEDFKRHIKAIYKKSLQKRIIVRNKNDRNPNLTSNLKNWLHEIEGDQQEHIKKMEAQEKIQL